MLVICPHCDYEENTTTKIVHHVKETDTLYEVGILCINCHKWTHCFYITGRIQKMRQKMDKLSVISGQFPRDIRLKKRVNKASKSYKRAFTQLQVLMQEKQEVGNV